MKIGLRNEMGIMKETKIGFSWTTFFFGFFVPLFRGDMKWFLIMLIGGAVVGLITSGIGGWIIGVIFAFMYNKIYIKELIEKGYRPANENSMRVLQENHILVPTNN
ncbi:DUF2628 domain-containing protein [Marinococcus sp. PL1-022]|uniref:DUF2628 domain-containing protein n=1 Tax=Marinococcus sp. PL1-022 TaxID=3095363 RepID=UPI0029C3537A|nr:DUF2628 domain-containing protein [Marinococcus sp. PL1-022]MDX6153587.1 DUF2628 domain-containing protein [Marinococcus sp. PL1-022]